MMGNAQSHESSSENEPSRMTRSPSIRANAHASLSGTAPETGSPRHTPNAPSRFLPRGLEQQKGTVPRKTFRSGSNSPGLEPSMSASSADGVESPQWVSPFLVALGWIDFCS